MFGAFRLMLALMVVLDHYWHETFNFFGAYAVVGFYVLSGYLMTLILNRTYVGAQNRWRYFANRALRIYPPYFAVLALGIVLAACFPDGKNQINGLVRWPETTLDWMLQFTVFGINGYRVRLVPPAWSLSIELFYYVLHGFGLSANPKIARAWLMVAGGYAAYLLTSDGATAYDGIYNTTTGASFFFALGCFIYHHKSRLQRAAVNPLIPIALYLCLVGALHNISTSRQAPILIVIAIIVGWSILSLADRKSGVIDTYLGRYSYPLFLCHWHAAIIVTAVVFSGVRPPSYQLFFTALPLSFAICWMVITFVENPIGRLRDRIRTATREALAAA